MSGMEWSEHRPERNETNGDEHDGPSIKANKKSANDIFDKEGGPLL